MRPILTTLLLCCFCGSLFSATFTVNTLDNTNDNVCDGVHCSLREAINAANAAAGADDIVFSVAGTIDLSTGMGNLPVITDQVSIVALNITIANAPGNGIDFTGAANNSALSGLTVVGAQGAAGIFVNAVTGVTLTGCSAISNGNPATSQGGGISLLFSAGSSIVNCTVDGNAENGIFMLDSPGISVSNCTVTNNSFHGIIGVGCNAIQITNNGSNNNGTGAPVPATGANSSSGILISGCNSAIIEDNVCNGSPLEAGIFIEGSNGCIVRNNGADGNFETGIWIINSSDGTYTGNFTTNNMGSGSAPGILIDAGQDNDINSNVITGNECAGVQVNSGTGNRIVQNVMSDNSCEGIILAGGNNNFPAPVICSITETEITGTVTAVVELHLYTADEDDPCQGVGFISTITAGPGAFTFPGAFILGNTYAITATDASDNTSQFACDVTGLGGGTVSSDSPICEGETLGLMASGGTSYSWTGPNGFSSTQQNPTIPNISLAGAGTYTVQITSGACSTPLTTEVVVVERPDAGSSNVVSICNGGATTINFFTSLLGTPDTDGSWTESTASGVNISNPSSVDFAGIPAGVYFFNYSVTGDPPCPSAGSTLTVQVNAAPDAGGDGAATFCDNPIVNLNNVLTGIPDGGGNWSDDDGAGVVLGDGSNVDFTGVLAGDYEFTYTVSGTAPCSSDDATVTISIGSAPDAGQNGTASVCNDGAVPVDLFAALGGTPDGGGTWSEISGSGVNLANPNNVDFSGVPAGTYAFNYTITASSPSCPDASAAVTITVTAAPNAGQNGTLSGCNSSTINLFSGLNGTPELGGSWGDDDGTGVIIGDGTAVDFSGVSAGTYDFTYTATGLAPCTNSTAVVSVTISETASAGTDGSTTICNGGSTIVNLLGSLGGSPDGGGNWSDDSGANVVIGDGTNVDFAGVPAGNYDFTYNIPPSGDCAGSSAVVSVTVNAAPNAGADATSSICEGSTLDFFGALNGTPQLGGNWQDNDGSGVDLNNPNNVSFAGVTPGTYTYTYMVSGVPPCIDDMATLTVNVEAAPNAGADGNATACNGGAGTTVNLFGSLNGSPSGGGAWIDDGGTGVIIGDGTNVDFSGVPGGTYNFTYSISGVGLCPTSSAIVTVTVNEQPNAGIDNQINICQDDVVDFFAQIGNPDPSGFWVDNFGSGVNLANPSAVSFSGITPGSYTYTYNLSGIAPCGNSTATLTVEVVALPNAGIDGATEACFSPSFVAVNLAAALNGTPDFGGTWSDDDFTGVNLSDPTAVNFANVPPGTYQFTYSVAGNASCPNATARVTVTINSAPSAGSDGSFEICESPTPIFLNLFNRLGGAPDFGGSWTDENFAGVNLSDPTSVNFAGVPVGNYEFVYTAPSSPGCTPSTASVFILISEAPDAGIDGIIDLCGSDNNSAVDLFSALGGTPSFSGTWNDDDNAGVNLFDPVAVNFNGIPVGAYQFTYTVPSNNPACPDATSTVIVNIEAGSNAGQGTAGTFCLEPGVLVNLFNLLTDNPDIGGTWIDDNSSGVDLSDPVAVDFSLAPAGTYNFTYATAGGTFCSPSSTVVTVTTISPPSAGTNSTVSICNDAAATLDLLASLNGTPETGGTWTDNDGSGVDLSNPASVSFSGVTPGTFSLTYIVPSGNTFCPDATATLVVTVDAAPNAGEGGSVTTCNQGIPSETTVDLVALLSGTPDADGTWSDNDGAGVDITAPTAVNFSGVLAGTYTFTYTVTGTNPACLTDEATVTIIVEDCSCPGVSTIAPDPLCNDSGQLDLSTLEVNTDPGTWSITGFPASGDIAQLTGTLFDATGATPGAYTVTFTLNDIPGSPSCPASSSQTIEVFESASAGTGNARTSCNLNATVVILSDLLDGADSGGTWSVNAASSSPDAGAFNADAGTFNIENHPTGTFEFDYTIAANGACAGSMATVSVTVTTLTLDLAISNTIECAGDNTGAISATVTGGSGTITYTWGDVADNTAIRTNLGAGTYSLTVTDESGCELAESITLSEPDDLVLNCAQELPASGPAADDGSASITISGGTAPFSLMWDGQSTGTTTVATAGTEMIENLAAGTYNLTVTDDNNCEETCQFTITTTACPPSDSTFINQTTCDPAAVDTIVTVLQDQLGCDSTVVVIIDLLPSNIITLNEITCDADQAGEVRDTLMNQFGCDSIIVQTFTFSPPDTTELTEVSCQPEDAGVFTQMLTNSVGCDSVVITTVSFDPADIDVVTIDLLTCDESEAGEVRDTLLNQFGCDSIIVQTFTFSPPDTTELTEVSCQPEDAGVFTQILTNSVGCDSVVITTVSFDPTDIDIVNIDLLTCDESEAGEVRDTLLNQFGCDSIIVQTFTFSPPDTTELTEVSCQPDDAGVFTQILINSVGCDSVVITTVSFDATDIDIVTIDLLTCDESEAGEMRDTLLNQFGCDSIIVQTFTFSPPDTTELTEVSCQPEDAGVFTQILTNSVGCDSVVITTVSFDPMDIDVVNIDLLTCDESEAGEVRDTLLNQFGCDSIIVQTFTFSPPDTTELTEVSCQPEDAGVFTQVLTNSIGCDSVVITTISFDPTDIDIVTIDLLTCDESEAGEVRDTLLNQFGCDSIIVQTFTFSPPDTTELTEVSCQPEDAGVFTQVLTNSVGCDSMVITTINFDPTDIDIVTIDLLTCDESEAGEVRDTLLNQFGCDSIIVQTFTFSPPDTTELTQVSCQPEDAGVFTQVFTNSIGCDSVVITTISFDPTDIDVVTIDLLTCDESEAGEVRDTLLNQFGCDSIIVQTFTFSPPDTTELTQVSCQPEDAGVFTQVLTNSVGCDSVIITTINFDATDIDVVTIDLLTCDESEAGEVRDTLLNQFGCDSIIVQTFTFSPPDTTELTEVSCQPDDAGVFTEVFTNSIGCDSVVITTVSFDPTDIDMVTIDLLTCDESEAGEVRDTLLNQFGCDSIIVQTFTFSPPDTTELTEVSCQPDDAGIFTQVLTNSVGCDSVIITTVSFDPTDIDITSIDLTTCDPDMVGTTQDTLTNQLGCDSIIIQTFSLAQLDTVRLSETTCIVDDVGIFEEVFISSEGCDSVVITEVSLLVSDIMVTDDSFETDAEGSLSDDVSSNDDVGTGATYEVLSSPQSGELVLNASGTFSYQADPDFVGTDEFSYEACSIDCPEDCSIGRVSIEVFSEQIDVPNAFSPNGDGTNETFIITGIEQFEDPRLMVVNRWGEVLFEAQPYGNDWDGSNQDGQPLPEGTYYYVLWLDVNEGTQLKGAITIIR